MNIEYPVFSGRAFVSGIVEHEDGKVFTVIDYLTINQEKDVKEPGILDVLLESKREELKKDLEARTKRVIIPMRLDPSLIDGAEIRARHAQSDFGDGVRRRTYEIEVIRGRSQASGDIFAMMGELAGTRHTGFKYIKVFDS